MLCKVCKITVSAKCGTNKHVLQVEAKTLAAGDLPPKCKQMIQPNITGALTSYTSYGSKSKRWLEIHGCSVEKRIFTQRVKDLNSEYMCPGGKCFSVLECDSSVQTTEELQVTLGTSGSIFILFFLSLTSPSYSYLSSSSEG